MAEGLQLSPHEERLLNRILLPNPPGRIKEIFQRPVRGPRDITLAVLILILVIALLGLVGNLIGNALSDSVRNTLDFVVIVGAGIALIVRDARIASLERLVRRLYGSLEQGNQDRPDGYRGTAGL